MKKIEDILDTDEQILLRTYSSDWIMKVQLGCELLLCIAASIYIIFFAEHLDMQTKCIILGVVFLASILHSAFFIIINKTGDSVCTNKRAISRNFFIYQEARFDNTKDIVIKLDEFSKKSNKGSLCFIRNDGTELYIHNVVDPAAAKEQFLNLIKI